MAQLSRNELSGLGAPSPKDMPYKSATQGTMHKASIARLKKIQSTHS
jgi:hypothetical protein